MPHDPRKCLEDMRQAADFLVRITAGRTARDYSTDEILRSVVERKFEIIGEALARLHKIDATLATQIPDHRAIISFRNVLIHGYDSIDAQAVWDIVKHDLPRFQPQVERLLNSLS